MSVDPLRLVFSFIFNQAVCLLLHPTNPYQGINFLLFSAAYSDATKLFQGCILEVLQSRHYYRRDILARYLQLRDWDPVRNRFATMLIKINIYIGGLIAIEYGDYMQLLTI